MSEVRIGGGEPLRCSACGFRVELSSDGVALGCDCGGFVYLKKSWRPGRPITGGNE